MLQRETYEKAGVTFQRVVKSFTTAVAVEAERWDRTGSYFRDSGL